MQKSLKHQEAKIISELGLKKKKKRIIQRERMTKLHYQTRSIKKIRRFPRWTFPFQTSNLRTLKLLSVRHKGEIQRKSADWNPAPELQTVARCAALPDSAAQERPRSAPCRPHRAQQAPFRACSAAPRVLPCVLAVRTSNRWSDRRLPEGLGIHSCNKKSENKCKQYQLLLPPFLRSLKN